MVFKEWHLAFRLRSWHFKLHSPRPFHCNHCSGWQFLIIVRLSRISRLVFRQEIAEISRSEEQWVECYFCNNRNTLILGPKFHQISISTECTAWRTGQSCTSIAQNAATRTAATWPFPSGYDDEASRAHCKLLLPWAYIGLRTRICRACILFKLFITTFIKCWWTTWTSKCKLYKFKVLTLSATARTGLSCASVTHGAAISTIATLPRPTGYDNETLRAQNKFTICRANWHPSGILWTAHGHYLRTVRTARKVVCLFHTWLHNKINQLCLKLLNGLF